MKQERYRQTRNIATISLAGNIFLAIIKVSIGVISHSSALLADGLNSAGDVFSTLVTLIGNAVAKKPRDEDHPYGHGKAEYVFAGVIGLFLLLVAVQTVKSSIESILHPQPLEHIWAVLAVFGITIIVKIGLYIYTKSKGAKLNNPLLAALARDHRSDVFVTAAAIIGVVGAYLGAQWLDGALGIVIACVIGYSGIEVIKDANHVLMDTSEDVSSPIMQKCIETIEQYPEVDHIDSIVTRSVGPQICFEIKISVPPTMTVKESHDVGKRIEKQLLEDDEVAYVLIHINPV